MGWVLQTPRINSCVQFKSEQKRHGRKQDLLSINILTPEILKVLLLCSSHINGILSLTGPEVLLNMVAETMVLPSAEP